jgi:two-component system cell cycle response regulator
VARILLIEDNPANLDLVVYLLQAFGHQPIEARDGRAGLAAAHREVPDLILCDLQMPELDGYEVARQLKQDSGLRGVPLLAVTAYAMVGDRDRILAAGFNGYIPKPIVPETFVQQIEAFLPPGQRSPQRTAPPAAAANTADQPPAPRATVLVVDDTLVNVDLLRGILEPSGYAVVAAYPVSQALAVARRSPPDVVVSDLRMPGADGYELLRQFQADPALRNIPVMIHSASAATPKEQALALALGAVKFVQRPIEPHLLLEALEACLRA